jgi:hypothetical protein
VKIKVVVPHNGRISNATLACLDNIKDREGLEFRFGKHPGSVYIAENRNDQCYGLDGLDEWPDAFLFIDGDMEFTLADIHALAVRDVEICSGAYCYKEAPLAEFLVAGMWIDGYPGHSGRKPLFRSELTDGFFPVDWTGAGFLLVKKTALRKMLFPWFYHPVMAVPPGAGPFPQKAVGEDIGFCLRAREAGIKVYLDADIRIGHINPNKGEVMEQKNRIPPSHAETVLAIQEAQTRVVRDYSTAVQMIVAKDARIAELEKELKEAKGNSVVVPQAAG